MTTHDVHLDLSAEEAQAMLGVIDEVLGELTHEIAATDNAAFRAQLTRRRELIRKVRGGLEAAGAPSRSIT